MAWCDYNKKQVNSAIQNIADNMLISHNVFPSIEVKEDSTIITFSGNDAKSASGAFKREAQNIIGNMFIYGTEKGKTQIIAKFNDSTEEKVKKKYRDITENRVYDILNINTVKISDVRQSSDLEEHIKSPSFAEKLKQRIEYFERWNEYVESLKLNPDTKSASIDYILNISKSEESSELYLALRPYLRPDAKIYFNEIEKPDPYWSNAIGTTDGKGNVILWGGYLSLDLVLHEILHDFTLEKIETDPVLRERLLELYNSASKIPGATLKFPYAFTNLHEFVSEAFGEPGFRELLANTEFNQYQTLYDRFVRLIKNILTKYFSLSFEVKESKVKDLLDNNQGLFKNIKTVERSILSGVFNLTENLIKERNIITENEKLQASRIYSDYLNTTKTPSLSGFLNYVEDNNIDFTRKIDAVQFTPTVANKSLTTTSKKIQDLLQKLYPGIKLDITNNPVWDKGGNIFNQEEYSRQVQYRLKAMDILLSDKATQVFNTGKKNNWSLDKILTQLQIPKDQKKIILNKNIKDKEGIIAALLSDTSFTVMIKTATETSYDENIPDDFDPMEYAPDDINYITTPTAHHLEYSVPGGINYRENEIVVPDVVSPIRGHAGFSTDHGIGWFRSDERGFKSKAKKVSGSLDELKSFVLITVKGNKISIKDTFGTDEIKYADTEYLDDQYDIRNGTFVILKDTLEDVLSDLDLEYFIDREGELTEEDVFTRRILEVQSVFQDGVKLFDFDGYNFKVEEGEYLKNNSPISKKEYFEAWNSFLEISDTPLDKDSKQRYLRLFFQKDNNWIRFFLHTIIQDSAKKGYKKVWFPRQETAAEIQKHKTKKEFINEANREIGRYEAVNKYLDKKIIVETPDGFEYKTSATTSSGSYNTREKALLVLEDTKEFNTEQINDYKKQIKDVESDITKLSSVSDYYEKVIFNILKKSGLSPKGVIDENKRGWYEISITPETLSTIFLQKNEANRIIGQANIEAMTVLVDAINQKQDTLPHEYAHHYIAWFRDTSIVQKAIKKWGSEEALVDSIGKQAVAQKGEALNWWKKFVRWIMNRLNKVPNLEKQELTNTLTDAFLRGVDLETGQTGISLQRSRELASRSSNVFNQQIKPEEIKLEVNSDKLKDLKDYFSRETKSTIDFKYNPDLFEGSFPLLEHQEEILQLNGEDILAHGMAKGSTGSQLNDLINILSNGIDPNRGGGLLYTAPLVTLDANKRGGAALGTSGGTAYRDGAFMLMGRKGLDGPIRSLRDIHGVLVNQAVADSLPDLITKLRESFPGLIIESYRNAPDAIKQMSSIEFYQKKRKNIHIKQNLDRHLKDYLKVLGIELIESIDAYNKKFPNRPPLTVNAVANIGEKIIAYDKPDGQTLPEEIAHFLLWTLYVEASKDRDSNGRIRTTTDIGKMMDIVYEFPLYTEIDKEYTGMYSNVGTIRRGEYIALEALAKLLSEKVYKDYGSLSRRIKEGYESIPDGVGKTVLGKLGKMVKLIKDLFLKYIIWYRNNMDKNAQKRQYQEAELDKILGKYKDKILEGESFDINDLGEVTTFIDNKAEADNLRMAIENAINTIKDRITKINSISEGMTAQERDSMTEDIRNVFMTGDYFKFNDDIKHEEEIGDSLGVMLSIDETDGRVKLHGYYNEDNGKFYYFDKRSLEVLEFDPDPSKGQRVEVVIGSSKMSSKKFKELSEKIDNYRYFTNRSTMMSRVQLKRLREDLENRQAGLAIVRLMEIIDTEYKSLLTDKEKLSIDDIGNILDFVHKYHPVIKDLLRIEQEYASEGKILVTGEMQEIGIYGGTEHGLIEELREINENISKIKGEISVLKTQELDYQGHLTELSIYEKNKKVVEALMKEEKRLQEEKKEGRRDRRTQTLLEVANDKFSTILKDLAKTNKELLEEYLEGTGRYRDHGYYKDGKANLDVLFSDSGFDTLRNMPVLARLVQFLKPADVTSSPIMSFIYENISKLNIRVLRKTEEDYYKYSKIEELKEGIDRKKIMEFDEKGDATGFFMSEIKWYDYHKAKNKYQTELLKIFGLPEDSAQRAFILNGGHVYAANLKESDEWLALYGWTSAEILALANTSPDLDLDSKEKQIQYMKENPRGDSVFKTKERYEKAWNSFFEKNQIENLDKVLAELGLEDNWKTYVEEIIPNLVQRNMEKLTSEEKRAIKLFAIIRHMRDKIENYNDFEIWMHNNFFNLTASNVEYLFSGRQKIGHIFSKFEDVKLKGSLTRPSDGSTVTFKRRDPEGKISEERIKTNNYNNDNYNKLSKKEKEYLKELYALRKRSLNLIQDYSDRPWLYFYMPAINASFIEDASNKVLIDRSEIFRQEHGIDEEVYDFSKKYSLSSLMPPIRYIVNDPTSPIVNLSTDHSWTAFKFHQMAVNYNIKAKSKEGTNFMKSLALMVQEMEDSSSIEKGDPFETESALFHKVKDFLEYQIGEKGAGKLGNWIAWEKVSQKLGNYVRAKSLLGNILAVLTGGMKSRVVLYLEKKVGQFLDDDDYSFATGSVMGEVTLSDVIDRTTKAIPGHVKNAKRVSSIIANWTKDKKTGFITAEEDIINRYIVVGEHRLQDTQQNKALTFLIKKLPWGLWNAVDIWANITSIRAIGNQYKYKDGKFYRKTDANKDLPNFIDIYDEMLLVKDKDRVKYEEYKKAVDEVIDSIVSKSKKLKAIMDQNLTAEQKTELQRNILTQHLAIFRNFFFQIVPRSFTKEWHDYSILEQDGEILNPLKMKGFLHPKNLWDAVGDYYYHGNDTLVMSTWRFLWDIEKSPGWKDISKENKHVIQRLRMTYAVLFMSSAIAAIFYSSFGDEEETPWMNLLSALLLRFSNEAMADVTGPVPLVTSTTEMLGLLKDPIVSVRFFQDSVLAVLYILLKALFRANEDPKKSGKFKGVPRLTEALIKATPFINHAYNYSPWFPIGPEDRFEESTSDMLDWQKRKKRESLLLDPVSLLNIPSNMMYGEPYITYKKAKSQKAPSGGTSGRRRNRSTSRKRRTR